MPAHSLPHMSEPRRKRRFEDQPPVSTGSSTEAAAAFLNSLPAPEISIAQQVAQRANVTLAQGGALSSLSESRITHEVVINGQPPHMRAQLTRGGWQKEMSLKHGVAVITKGRYLAPGQNLDVGERELHLLLEGPPDKVKIAADEIEGMMKEATKPVKPPVAPLSTVSGPMFVDIGTDFAPGVDPIPQIRGPNGSYFDHIGKTTGATIRIVQRGSDTMIQIEASTHAALMKAHQLALDLVSTVRRKMGLPASAPPPPPPQVPVQPQYSQAPTHFPPQYTPHYPPPYGYAQPMYVQAPGVQPPVVQVQPPGVQPPMYAQPPVVQIQPSGPADETEIDPLDPTHFTDTRHNPDPKRARSPVSFNGLVPRSLHVKPKERDKKSEVSRVPPPVTSQPAAATTDPLSEFLSEVSDLESKRPRVVKESDDPLPQSTPAAPFWAAPSPVDAVLVRRPNTGDSDAYDSVLESFMK